jgi:hypothetical protein
MDKMDLPGIDAEKLRQELKKDFEDCVTEVVEAIDTARMATGKLRQKIFEKALQMKVDAAQAAFSPSGQNKDKK